MVHVSPVERFEVDTADPEQAHQWLRDSYTDHTPVISGDSSDFRMRVASVATNLFRVDDVVHTMRLAADVEPYRSLFISRVRRGGYWAQGAERTVQRSQGEITLLDPFRPGRTGWDALDVQIVVLDLSAAGVVAEGATGAPAAGIDFELSTPVGEEQARHWASAVDHVVSHVLAVEEVSAQPLVRAEAFRSLVTATLATFPNSATAGLSDRPLPGSLRAEPAALRRAIEFIESHAPEPIGLTDIAEAARIGPRGLQSLFRRHRDQTPLKYLRQVRMAGAHRDLQAADPTRGDTVAAIAARWGFAHIGRFSAEYRRAYGRSPGETLRG